MNDVQLLQEVVDHLKKGWCQKHSALDANGEEIPPSHPEAHCFCITGVLDRLTAKGQDVTSMVKRLVVDLKVSPSRWTPATPYDDYMTFLIQWNDSSYQTQDRLVGCLRSVLDKWKEQDARTVL